MSKLPEKTRGTIECRRSLIGRRSVNTSGTALHTVGARQTKANVEWHTFHPRSTSKQNLLKDMVKIQLFFKNVSHFQMILLYSSSIPMLQRILGFSKGS